MELCLIPFKFNKGGLLKRKLADIETLGRRVIISKLRKGCKIEILLVPGAAA